MKTLPAAFAMLSALLLSAVDLAPAPTDGLAEEIRVLLPREVVLASAVEAHADHVRLAVLPGRSCRLVLDTLASDYDLSHAGQRIRASGIAGSPCERPQVQEFRIRL
ncbi:MAG: hypothetical protein AAGE01_15715 [Pseudomonadota bacterium]